MKSIQYIINNKYDKSETLRIAGILFHLFINTSKKLRNKDTTYNVNDFAIYPVNPLKINKFKKIILSASTKGLPLLEALDELFMEEVKKNNYNIQRQEYVR